MKENRIDNNQEEVKNNIKTNLVELRKASKLSKRDVANVLGVNENTYRIWEDPKRSSPKMHNLVKIAQIYNVSCDFLLRDNINSKSETVISKSVSASSPDDEKKRFLSSLDKYERLIVMKIRQLDIEERNKINDLIEKLLDEQK